MEALQSSTNGGDVEALPRWIRSLLLQFIGKQHVEQACTEMHRYFPTSPVKIAVMTANRLHYSIPEWSEFKAVISDALDACPDLPAECNIDSVVMRLNVTTVPRSYISRLTFRICPSFSSMTPLTFYNLLSLTHAYDFHMLVISHAYNFHMPTTFMC